MTYQQHIEGLKGIKRSYICRSIVAIADRRWIGVVEYETD